MPGTTISFNSNDLQTANIITADISHEKTAGKSLQMSALAHVNKSVIPFSTYPSKTIKISGTIHGSTIADLDSRLDAFRGYFYGTDKNLDIGYNGTTRRYIATAEDVSIDRPGGLLFAEFDVSFVCTQPFGQNTTTTTAVTATGRTSSAYTDTYTFIGSAPWQTPIFTFTLTSVTLTGSNGSISIGNTATGQTLTVTAAFVSGDVVVIDTSTFETRINGALVDTTGAYPYYAAGSQNITYSDTFSARTFNASIVYYPLYF